MRRDDSCCIDRYIGRKREDKVQPAVIRHPQSAGRVPVVAIVDDDPAVAGSLKFSLELEGFTVRAYGSAAEFLDAGDFACACCVVDQRMPGMSGMDLIAALRDRKVDTPAILLTSHPNAAVSARAARAGVPIVEKPLLGNALVDKIREACGVN
jgi:two-component system, LuxR family, response regulator FixJ